MRDLGDGFPDRFVTVVHSGTSAASVVAVMLDVFYDMLMPGRPDEPSDAAAGPPVMVRLDEIEVMESGGSFEAGKRVDVRDESSEHRPAER